MTLSKSLFMAALLGGALGLSACGGEEAAVSLPAEPTQINWDDLLPEGELDLIEDMYADMGMMQSQVDHMGGAGVQLGTFNVEESLLGQRIRMPGFILPLDLQAGGEISEFLLVPYFGACVHTPPPPPNQIVYVVVEEPILVERMWDPVWVTGELTADRHMNELGDAAYTLILESHEPYEI